MAVSWVAGSLRAKSLALRRLGQDRARSVAASSSLDVALDRLTSSPYSHAARPGQSLAAAQDAVSATALWHLRVMAGWLPRSGAEMARTLAGYWEVANVSILLARIEGGGEGALFNLGALATAWRRLATARDRNDVRATLAASAWGDPGTAAPSDLLAWLRMRWAERVAQTVPGAYAWGAGLLALLVARQRLLAGAQARLTKWPAAPLGTGWQEGMTLQEFAEGLPRAARWAIEGVTDPAELWRAEGRWWATVERESVELLARFQPGEPRMVVASAALLLADAWRVRAALEVAARQGDPLELFDALG